MDPITVKYILFFGLLHASIYMVFSLGFSLVFGVAKIPNLAFGSYYVFSAYLAYVLLNLGVNPVASMLFSVVAAGVLSLAVGEFAIKPALKTQVSIFITTFAVAYILEEFFRIEMGLKPITLPALSGISYVAEVPLNNHWILVSLVGLLMTVTLLTFLKRVKLGMSIRAVAESWEESMRLGINPLTVLRVTLFITGMYAGAAGVLLTPLKALTPDAGWGPLFTSFAIIALGGVGSILGTVVAALIYGLFEQALAFTLGSGVAKIAPLILIIVVLIFKPEGLFGAKE